MANRNSKRKAKAFHKSLAAQKMSNPNFKQFPKPPKKRPGSWHGCKGSKHLVPTRDVTQWPSA
jgi:hypothetical protein